MATTTSGEGVFAKLANEVLEAAEHIVTRVDEGVSAILHGKLPQDNGGGDANEGDPNDAAFVNDPLMDEDLAGSPLEGIADSVLSDIMGGQVGPQTPIDHFHAFRAAIDWTEPFIISLLVFHVVVFFLCIWASRPTRSIVPRISLMLFMGILVRCAERMNAYAAHHWQDFCTQNYFDSKGIFMAIMVSGPLLVNSFIMLVFYLREASQLLVQVKTMELKQKKEAEKKKEQESKKND